MEREDWNRRWLERGLHCHDDDPSAVLVAELGSLPPGRALDLGCGAGRSAIWLADRGWRVTAVDFSDTALGMARTARPEVEWVLADLRAYDPGAESFDLVLVLYVHVPADERTAMLARAAAALAPGGRILVVGHDVTNLGTGAPGPSRPEVLYTPEDVARDLGGLAVQMAVRVTRRVETDAGDAEAIDTLVLARKA
jgi:SAM-dependent methyltransferase